MTGEEAIGRESVPPSWEGTSPDPDLRHDLEYEIEDWETVSARAAGEDRLLFLPSDESDIRDEAFIVADPDVVCDTTEKL